MIRLICESDKIDILNINWANFKEYEKYSLETIENFCNNRKGYVILINDIIIGYILHEVIELRHMIVSLAIDKNYRNQGYAKKLLSYFIKQNSNPLYLHVRIDNSIAIKLYRSLGFRIKESQILYGNLYYLMILI